MWAHKIFGKMHTCKNIFIYTKKSSISNNSSILRQLTTQRCSIRNVICFNSKRNISFQSLRKPNVEKLRINDNIPEKFELIYRCTMSSYLYAAQISATIGAVVVCIIGILNYDPKNLYEINLSNINLQNIFHTEYQLVIFSLAFVLINISVMILVSRFPVRIYFNQETKKYLGVIFGKVPKTKNVLEFSIGDVKHSPQIGILPWYEFSYKLRDGKRIYLLDHYFRKPDDMNIMLGYTKL